MAPAPDTPAAPAAQPWGTVFADKMLIMPWTAEKGWQSASIRPATTLPLPPASSVLHYGTSVFEGMKVFNTPSGPCVFRPDLHVARLAQSAGRIALPVPPDNFLPLLLAYARSVRDATPHAPPDALYLRATLIATSQRLGGRPATSALLFVIAAPVGSFFARPAEALQPGLRLTADVRHARAAPGGVGYCKTGGNYAASLGPQRDASARGFDQVLWLSDLRSRRVSEVGVMNIFFALRGPDGGTTLVTPEPDGSFLNGITRRSVLALARELGIEARERVITVDDVFAAAREGRLVDAFGTGTAAVVCPIASIECDGETVHIRETERDGDLSVTLRKKLLAIQADGTHPWMMPIDDADADDTNAVSVKESELPVTTACIGL